MLRRCFCLYGTSAPLATFEPFELYVYKETGICEIVVNNKKNPLNLLDRSYFASLLKVTHYLSSELNGVARVGILTSKEGTPFSAGLDLKELQELQKGLSGFSNMGGKTTETTRMPAMQFQRQHAVIRFFQCSVSSLARCHIPIVCAIDGYCIGGATSIITACDFRYATEKTSFSVKETQVGLAADLGVLQRLPHIVGEGRSRELAYTARVFTGKEAKQMGLVEDVFESREDMMKSARKTAAMIASNSPLAVQGTKLLMNHQTQPDVERSLEYTASWSAANIACEDVMEAAVAFAQKRPPQFGNFVVDTSSTLTQLR
ncbi:peroxisomal enoyl-CoA hydratase [Trypanosoma conorhini]|uniref:Peroxisomal enoyl-CoA hydratase n=1 Tax=Trypanosoma conorhini TaxID=83891 RepID=A0A422NFK3_9TRYP|nr:peroxisomal enoyl-CoA hydratase [Trypanosoma conorhini]RNF04245.1 peroxisomal enoyl-CoA hydratase [Trypanosoma conorhini]